MVPESVRIRFEKTGRLRYISHLDLDRTLRTAFVRTKIPIWYTEGFNPHAKMVFAQPLPLFAESKCELLDIKITEKMPFDEIAERLRGALTEELYIVDVYTPRDKLTDIAYAEYRITGEPRIDEKRVNDLLSSEEISITKRTKSGERTVNIRPSVKKLELNADGSLTAVLDASGASYLNPELLCRALLPEDADFLITRTDWLRDGENGELVSIV